MLKKILAFLMLLAVAIIGFAATRPADFRIERSLAMNAPAATIFPLVNDLRRMSEWSPWAKMDPNAKNTYEGPASGVGAAMAWDGNSQVGAGRMTITDSNAPSLVRMKLEFTRPFAAVNLAEFTLVPEGAQTKVTWAMNGRDNLMGKVMALFFNRDKMVGGQFEKGLATMKSMVENATNVAPANIAHH